MGVRPGAEPGVRPDLGEPSDLDVKNAGVGTLVIYDNEKPHTYITAPNLSFHRALADLTGTAGDNAKISEVKFTVYQPSQGKYYDPAQSPVWVTGSESAAPWIAAQPTIYQTTASWTYNIQTSTWNSGFSYRVRARAKDAAGNYDTAYNEDVPVRQPGAHLHGDDAYGPAVSQQRLADAGGHEPGLRRFGRERGERVRAGRGRQVLDRCYLADRPAVAGGEPAVYDRWTHAAETAMFKDNFGVPLDGKQFRITRTRSTTRRTKRG